MYLLIMVEMIPMTRSLLRRNQILMSILLEGFVYVEILLEQCSKI